MVRKLKVEDLKKQLQDLHEESFGWALQCCDRQYDIAYEALQNAYLKILDRKAVFGGKSSFKTWLFSVIRYTTIDELNSQKKMMNRFVQMEATQFAISDSHDKSYKYDDDIKVVAKAVGRLQGRQREVLHLVFYQGMTLDETAEVLNISGGSARQHYHRAKMNLKMMLTENELEHGRP